MTLPDTLAAGLEAQHAAADERAHTDEHRCTRCGDWHVYEGCWSYEDSGMFLDDDTEYGRRQ